MALLLLLVAVGVIAVVALFSGNASVERAGQTTAHLVKAQAALEQFTAGSSRLPCPADPTLDTGDEVRAAGSPDCGIPNGTLPWRTIGLRREDSLDAWGWKISYRVYTGPAGSLTQDGGASMVDCDTNEALPATTTPLVGNAGGLCQPQPAQNTRAPDFLVGKGLRVNDFGTLVTDVAYVLISHGPTGFGAFTSAGTQMAPPVNADELTNLLNLSPAIPYVAQAASPAGTPPGTAAHFDDVLVYRRLPELVKRANLAARDWPDAVLASIRFDAATLSQAVGAAVAPGDTGRATIDFYNARVSAFDSGGAQDITLATSGGNEGIGGATGGTSLAAGEGIRIDLTQSTKPTQFAVTLNDFGTLIGTWNEQVEFTFLDGATVKGTVVKAGCHPDGGLASFAMDVGSSFDAVEIRPLQTTIAFGFSFPSSFFVSEIAACVAGATCATSLQTAGNTCP